MLFLGTMKSSVILQLHSLVNKACQANGCGVPIMCWTLALTFKLS